MKKAVVYARVSSKKQEEEGYSIPAQLKFLNEYAAKHGFTIVKEFVDSETAKKAGRTHFGEMINFLKKNKTVNTILVEKTDRLYRNFRDYVLLDEFKNLEIHLVKEGGIISENSRSHEKLVHGFKVLMAKNYIDNLSEEIIKGQRQACEQGDYPSKPPYGYHRPKKDILIDPQTSPFVLRAFSLYAEGNMSLDDLCKRLYDDGFIYSEQKPRIYKGQLSKILKNPFYTGNFLYKDVLYEGRHEPLISVELFQNAQKAFKKDGKPDTHKTHNFIYSGLFKCAHCGSAIVGEIKKGKYIYYHCADKTKGCPNKKIYLREHDIDTVFVEALKRIQITPEHKNNIIITLKESHKDEQKFNQEELLKLNKRAETLRNRMSKLYLDKLDGNITNDFWADKNNEWTLEHARIMQEIDAHSKANINYMRQGGELLELLENLYLQYIQLDNDEKQKMLNYIFSNFLIDGQNVHYEYKKPFDLFAKGLSCSLNWRLIDNLRTFLRYQNAA